MTELYRKNSAIMRERYARGLAAAPQDFLTEQLVFAERPTELAFWCAGFAMTFGTGTVVSVAPELRACAEREAPQKHYRAVYGEYLRKLADEGNRLGLNLGVFAGGLGFALATIPGPPQVPDGMRIRMADSDWMNAEQANGRFENGVGEVGVGGRSFRNRFAAVLENADGEPVAVGGAFDTFEMLEVGVDVVRAHRGQGYGDLVVRAVTREVLERGQTPIYFCSASNIRSNRTALAAGYQPACCDGTVLVL